MPPKMAFVLCLAGCLDISAAFAQLAPAPAPPPDVHAPGGIWIVITNDYEAELGFGPLGKGWRKGLDSVKGVLTRTADGYSGTVTANVKSTQQMAGMMGVGNCGPGTIDDSQELQVIGHPVSGFNDLVQSVSWTTSSANSSLEYLALEFIPKTPPSMQPQNPDPGQDTVVFCHTLIENEKTAQSGNMFLPLNDSRWTMDGGGYIIALPLVGMLDYTDDTLAPRPNEPSPPPMPFKAKKSLWTIHVERL